MDYKYETKEFDRFLKKDILSIRFYSSLYSVNSGS